MKKLLSKKLKDKKAKSNKGTLRGGYKKGTESIRAKHHYKYSPAGGYGLIDGIMTMFFNNENTGEEDEYFKTFLGYNTAVPKMNPNAKTEWDDAIEQEKIQNGVPTSDFYGTTPRMDHNAQALADTLNLGKMYRHEIDLPENKSHEYITKMYKQAKLIMNNPGQWLQVEDYNLYTNPESKTTYELNPLGMLNKFGMKWDPEQGKLFLHDTYDFKDIHYLTKLMLMRPKEMKIRAAINFDPKKGSKIIREHLTGTYKWPDMMTSETDDSDLYEEVE